MLILPISMIYENFKWFETLLDILTFVIFDDKLIIQISKKVSA